MKQERRSKKVRSRLAKVAPPISDEALIAERDWVRAVVATVAMFARYQLSPKEALRQNGIDKKRALLAAVHPFDVEALNGQWPTFSRPRISKRNGRSTR